MSKKDLCELCEHQFMNPFDQYFCKKRPKQLKNPRYKCKDYKEARDE